MYRSPRPLPCPAFISQMCISDRLYIDAVTKAGGEAIYLPQIKTEDDAKNALAEIDALVVTGGEDIDPVSYTHLSPSQ